MECRNEDEVNEQPIEDGQATKYEAFAARANYLAGDRIDIMYAVKEICRHMASPTVRAWKKLKGLGRSPKGNTRRAMK